MARIAATKPFTIAEEVAHAITHGVGLLFSVAAFTLLVILASLRGDAWHVVSCSVYGATLVLLYTTSTFYHALTAGPAKSVFKTLDYASIYLLIAGTYTPFTLVSLRGGWGWSLFAVVWGLALIGVVRVLSRRYNDDVISLVFYVTLGWLALVAAGPLLESITIGGVALLGLGGLAYTAGVAFYCWERLPYNHAIWHLFVLAGSVLHFAAVLFYVVPPAAA